MREEYFCLRSFAARRLRISARGSDAAKTPQVRILPGPPEGIARIAKSAKWKIGEAPEIWHCRSYRAARLIFPSSPVLVDVLISRSFGATTATSGFCTAEVPHLECLVFMSPATHKKHGRKALIRCVIFDLDDTLYDCLGQRVRPSHRHAAEAMVRAGLKADVDVLFRARMRAFQQDPMLHHIDAVVSRQFQAEDPEAITRAARDAYFNCPVGKLRLFRGTRPVLQFLHSRGVKVFVVSFGEPEIQRAKVKALRLDQEPAIDKIFYADRDKLLTKEAAFKKIQQELGLDASEILVVGDRPMREIRAGKELGMHTVRIRHGEFAAQEPRDELEEPDYEVKNISEVKALPFEWIDFQMRF